MGCISDLLAGARSIDTEVPREGISRVVVRELNGLQARLGVDPGYPQGYEGRDQVIGVGELDGDVEGGQMTLQFLIFGTLPVQAGPFDWDASLEDIQGEIDSAADGEIPGYVAGDIVVSGDEPSAGNMVITFSGASVAGRYHALGIYSQLEDDNEDTVSAPDISELSRGQTPRTALAILNAAGIIKGGIPDQGETGNFLSANAWPGGSPNRLSDGTIVSLAIEASAADNADYVAAIKTAAGIL